MNICSASGEKLYELFAETASRLCAVIRAGGEKIDEFVKRAMLAAACDMSVAVFKVTSGTLREAILDADALGLRPAACLHSNRDTHPPRESHAAFFQSYPRGQGLVFSNQLIGILTLGCGPVAGLVLIRLRPLLVSHGVDGIRRWFGCGLVVVRLWLGCDLVVVRLRSGCGSVVVCCGLVVVSVAVLVVVIQFAPTPFSGRRPHLVDADPIYWTHTPFSGRGWATTSTTRVPQGDHMGTIRVPQGHHKSTTPAPLGCHEGTKWCHEGTARAPQEHNANVTTIHEGIARTQPRKHNRSTRVL